MFAELKTLLTKRSLTITVAALNGGRIRVNVVPHSQPEDKKVNEQISYSHKNEVSPVPDEAIKALTTPISITGMPEEIDEKLAATLTNFVESHRQLQESFNRATSEIAAAVKAIDERNKAKKEKHSNKAEKKEEQEQKKDDTLPLWWTNPNVAPPGTAQTTTNAEPADSTQPSLLSQPAEVIKQ
jgi:PRTRC genetic system protein E